MKILVCVKQVPDMASKFTINADGNWYGEQGLAWRMNEYDEFAVEQAVRLWEQEVGAELVVISIGPARCREAIKKALAMGADRGVHVEDENCFKKDPYQIAGILAEYAKGEHFDLIFTGMQSQDRGSGQVGVLLAGMLGLDVVTTIIGFAYQDGKIRVKRELEGGLKAVVEVSSPALLTCQLGLAQPRYPTLPNIMKAKKKELTLISVDDLQQLPSLSQTALVEFPQRRKGGLVLEGDVNDLADELVAILKEKTTVLARK